MDLLREYSENAPWGGQIFGVPSLHKTQRGHVFCANPRGVPFLHKKQGTFLANVIFNDPKQYRTCYFCHFRKSVFRWLGCLFYANPRGGFSEHSLIFHIVWGHFRVSKIIFSQIVPWSFFVLKRCTPFRDL